MRIRPCIDIHNGRVKQIVGSTLTDGDGLLKQNFVSGHDAAYYADLYRQMNLPGGHIILLNSAVKEPDAYAADRAQALAALAAFPDGMQVGGGITPRTAGDYLSRGASHVIVTSYVFRNGVLDMDRLAEMRDAVGKDHLVLDLSCRKVRCQDCTEYRVVTDRWQKLTCLVVNKETLDMLSHYCDEFLIHAADVEGKRGGIERELVGILGKWQAGSYFPVTYAGGIHNMEDLDMIRSLSDNRLDVTVGSALKIFGGSLDLAEMVGRASIF